MPVEKDSQGGAKSSAGLSASASAGTNEAEVRKALVRKQAGLERDLASLHDDARIASIRTEVEKVSAQLAALPDRLRRIRARGFRYHATLEQELERLAGDWAAFKPQIAAAIEREYQRLAVSMIRVQEEIAAARSVMSFPVAQVSERVERSAAQLENFRSEIRAAETTLRGMLSSASDGIRKTDKIIADAETMLDELDAASFRLLPGEAPVAMTQAEWLRGKDDEIKGLLFITDHRFLFERKEEIVTKRKLLVFTEKKLVRKLLFEAPIGSVEKVAVERVGGLFKKQVAKVTFTSPPAPYAQAMLSLRGDAEEWQGIITRIITGDADKDRVPGTAEEQPAESAEPAEPRVMKCSGCGATLTVPIVKGMKSVQCEYCGTVMRL
ncbi:MAG: hypothetical protein QHH80_02485 [Anaerolineae bacterium]|nr:hypothetical protein [Anaerolineae bacterium]